MSILSENELALLHTQLTVPMVAGDIIYDDLQIDEEVLYALHKTLSDLDPDSALLAIALSAKHIALKFSKDSSLATALSIEASKITDDYAPEWISNYQGGPVNEDRLYDTLRHIPEDLESLADLLETLRLGMDHHEKSIAELCNILAIQARAHMEISDYILGELEKRFLGEKAQGGKESGLCSMAGLPEQPPYNDNIILFPIHLRRQKMLDKDILHS